MTYGPTVPEEVIERRNKRLQPASNAPEVAVDEKEQHELVSSSDDEEFGPSLTQSKPVSEAEALKRLEERSHDKTWANMDPSQNPNRAGWMQTVPAELSGTFSNQSAQDRAKEMMGLKK